MSNSIKNKNVENYFDSQPESTKQALFMLRTYIYEAVPEAIEMFNYNIPAYALTKGGKRDQQIMIAGYKQHVGFYPHPSTMEKFDAELTNYKKGKGSVQFPINKPIPRGLIIKMVKYRKMLIDKSLANE